VQRVKPTQDGGTKKFFKAYLQFLLKNGSQQTKAISEQDILTASPTNGNGGERDKEHWKIGKAATLVMLQPSAPARKPIAWIHAPSQPLM
jgi:hypothetical protein